MKCSKCGEECQENQAFCIKCGSPMHVVPDFNLIEAELANNIGELLDEMKEEESKQDLLETAHNLYKINSTGNEMDDNDFQGEMPDEEVSVELKLIDVERMRKSEKKETAVINKFTAEQPVQGEEPEKKLTKKAKIAIGCGVFALIVILAITVVLVSANKKAHSYKYQYKKAVELYDQKSYDEALTYFQRAAELKEDAIAPREAMYNIYIEDNDSDNAIKMLKEIIAIVPTDSKYYTKLMDVYEKYNMTDEITALLKSVEGQEVAASLTAYSVTTPTFSVEEGQYADYLSIELTTTEGSSIYYTVNGETPTKDSKLYSEPISLDSEGDFTLQAVAINGKGISSSIVTKKYTIKLETPGSPVVTPAGGSYTAAQKIEVTVPDGSKVYYTLDGSEPSEISTEYTESIDMPRGNSVFSAIIIDKYGTKSDVTKKIYNLEIARVYTMETALTKLKNYLVSAGLITTVNGPSTFTYRSISIINNNEYYLIDTVIKTSDTGSGISYIFGVDTVTGDIVKVIKNEDGNYSISQ